MAIRILFVGLLAEIEGDLFVDIAALAAGGMRQFGGPAVLAEGVIGRLQRVMTSAGPGSGSADFLNRKHNLLLLFSGLQIKHIHYPQIFF
jgi:hypothetical protein